MGDSDIFRMGFLKTIREPKQVQGAEAECTEDEEEKFEVESLTGEPSDSDTEVLSHIWGYPIGLWA